ncbi:hypothetical protein EVAR_89028_1 [Eumeta japonica]|uniref:Uncharacterized protein n=1 Tax=Eumeta variegata TaxID=151549 RepID=A0A4C1YZM1_EUMVA|nr:hypothetical protein EVAR_89028_1 [Eumeta japonica]
MPILWTHYTICTNQPLVIIILGAVLITVGTRYALCTLTTCHYYGYVPMLDARYTIYADQPLVMYSGTVITVCALLRGMYTINHLPLLYEYRAHTLDARCTICTDQPLVVLYWYRDLTTVVRTATRCGWESLMKNVTLGNVTMSHRTREGRRMPCVSSTL